MTGIDVPRSRRLCARIGLAMAALFIAPAVHAAGETGDLQRSYFLEDAGETMPYRVYVPSSYDGSKAYPLVVVLHGSSSTSADVIVTPGLKEIAEERNVILLAPEGYNAFGGYGTIYPVVVTRDAASQVDSLLEASRPGSNAPKGMTRPREELGPAAPDDGAEVRANGLTDPRVSRLSEKDTMNALALVRKEFRIDDDRIYLMGNSMGGMGAAYLAIRYPEIWAAVSPSGGPFAAWSYPYFQLREGNIAALFVQGDADEHAHWKWSDDVVQRAKKEGVKADLLLVKDGDHVNAWVKALPQTFDFFLRHRKSVPAE